MIPSLASVNLGKMSGIILLVLLNLLILSTGASGTCVNVPNNEMIEYSCVGGSPFDLREIPNSAEKIRIANMSLPRVTRETFSKFGDNLWVLTCTHCGIREIDNDAFASLTNLQQLRLDNNRIREIRASWFKGLIYLTYLDMNFNEIEMIEDGVYGNLPGLVDFRVSGNKLRCLNIDAMSRLDDLKRIFLSNNPDFQCPNAVSKFLEEREVSFDQDPEWRRVPQDTVSAWRFAATATPGYHEKLISRTTEEPEYPTYSPPEASTSGRPTPPSPVYPDEGWFASSTAPYAQRERPTSAATDRDVWPASMPNSYPTRESYTAPSYPTRDSYPTTSTPSYPTRDSYPTPSTPFYPTRYWATTVAPSSYPQQQRQEWHEEPEEHDTRNPNEGEIYGQTNYYPPAMTRTSTDDPNADVPRVPYEDFGSFPYGEEETVTPAVHLTPPPPPIEYAAGNSAEVFTATDYAPYTNNEEPQRQTDEPAVHEIPIASQRPASIEESSAPTRQAEDVAAQPKVVDKYQAVQEPSAVTVAPPTKENAAGSMSHLGISAVIVAICVAMRPVATIL